MSIASMNADPMMPKMSVTPLATIVSTKASDGVIFCKPSVIARPAVGLFSLIGRFLLCSQLQTALLVHKSVCIVPEIRITSTIEGASGRIK